MATIKDFNPITLENFPAFLKAIRKAQNLTQKGLAKKLDNKISYRTIQGWEQGIYQPMPAVIPLLNLVLGLK